MSVQGYYFQSDSLSPRLSDSRDSVWESGRTDSRDPSIRNMTGLGQPLDERMDALAAALDHVEASCRHLGKELAATKQIVRYLLGARKRDMNWFNRYGGGGGRQIDPQSMHYWHETAQINAIFAFVQSQDNWQDAWDDVNSNSE